MPNVTTSAKKSNGKIIIPYCEAGLRAFEIMIPIAERIWATGQRETEEFMHEVAPQAVSLSERYENSRFLRTVQSPDGRREIIAYDYREKAVMLLPDEMREANGAES